MLTIANAAAGDAIPPASADRAAARAGAGDAALVAATPGDAAAQIGVLNRLGKAMADPSRSRILLRLLDAPGYPATLAAELGLSRTNVSNHLACLRGCGLVAATQEGRQTRYEFADPHLVAGIRTLVGAVLAVDAGAPCADDGCPCCAPGARR